jgi:hypothetical protein
MDVFCGAAVQVIDIIVDVGAEWSDNSTTDAHDSVDFSPGPCDDTETYSETTLPTWGYPCVDVGGHPAPHRDLDSVRDAEFETVECPVAPGNLLDQRLHLPLAGASRVPIRASDRSCARVQIGVHRCQIYVVDLCFAAASCDAAFEPTDLYASS